MGLFLKAESTPRFQLELCAAAHTAGCDIKFDASAADQVADCIETLVRLADQGRERVRELGAQIEGQPFAPLVAAIVALAAAKPATDEPD